MKLSVSILNAKDKKNTIKILNNTDISYIHFDVMDGNFVPSKSLSIEEIKELSNISKKKIDIHLMVENPIEYIENIKHMTNIEYITIHLEIENDIKGILSKIKSYGFKTGLSIKPNTEINELLPYLEYVDLILLMTVEPGLGGQQFMETSLERLNQLRKIVSKEILIEVDGGINNTTIKQAKEADIAVVGSYITKSENIVDKIKELQV